MARRRRREDEDGGGIETPRDRTQRTMRKLINYSLETLLGFLMGRINNWFILGLESNTLDLKLRFLPSENAFTCLVFTGERQDTLCHMRVQLLK